jgi:predicted porin
MSALVSARPALAQEAPAATPSPAAVFPITTETDLAGVQGPSLNGAAPGSVQVNLGARLYSSISVWGTPSGTAGYGQLASPQINTWFQLYPGFDYASPSGIHFGAQAQLWTTGNPQGGIYDGAAANNNAAPFGQLPQWHQAFGYVSSATFGKFQFGTPNSALTSMAVGTGDDFGTGMFFSWYSETPYVPWAMGDAYDNYNATEKVEYTTPTMAGFTAAISYQPSAVGMSWNDANTMGLPPGSAGLLSRNRIEVAGKYDGTLGIVGLKADLGYVFADAEKSGGVTTAQNVSFFNAGVEAHIVGFELEASVNSGKFNPNVTDGGNTLGPLPAGAKGTTAWIAGVGYEAGPIKVGAMYYGVSYDAADFGGALGTTGNISGEGIGASYKIGPGVVAYLDAVTANFDTAYTPVGGAAHYGQQHPQGVGVGTFFTW